MSWRRSAARTFLSLLALSFAASSSAIDLFSLPEPHAVGDLPFDLAVGNLDENPLPDIAVANRNSNDVSIVFNPAGPGAVEIRVAHGGTPDAVAIGDLNGDGHADVAVGRELAALPLAILHGHGDGSFDPPVPMGTIDVFPDAIWIGDLDADTDPDLVISSATSSGVIVYLNDGAGAFAETPYVIGTAPSYPGDLAVGDADDDGDLDLLITASLSMSPPVLLLNSGSGAFTPADPFTAEAGNFVSGAVGDLADDGTTELTLLDFNSSTLAVFPNEGDGAFGDPVRFPIGASTQPGGRVRLADLDDDGDLDAVVGLILQNPEIPVLLGNDSGGFDVPASYPAGGYGISGIALADMDADGDLDVAAVSKDDDLLVVLRNLTNAPTFVPHADTASGFALAPPRPNPARAPTIVFTLPRPAHVRLAVHDVAGRMVARLVDAPSVAGEHSVVWQGLADDGGRVTAGVYTLRLEADGHEAFQKIVLTR